jgi:predicted site-specific integrase-resolvase
MVTPMTDREPELLTSAEVARLFRVARSTVISWAYRGLLPYTTTPTGHLRFHRASIERRLAERDGTLRQVGRREPGRDEG